MSKVRHVRYYADELLTGTRRLSDTELGIYWRAISLIYSRGGPVHIDELADWCSTRRYRFMKTVEALVVSGKLTKDGPWISQARAMEELSRCHALAQQWTKNGQQGGRPPNKNNGLDNQEVPPNHNQELVTSNHTAPNGAVPPLVVVPPKPAEANHGGRGTRLAADWQPDVEDRQFAAGLGLDADSVAATYRDYWHAKAGADACKRDWRATWRNWCRRQSPGSDQPAFGRERPREDRRGPPSELRAAARAAARLAH